MAMGTRWKAELLDFQKQHVILWLLKTAPLIMLLHVKGTFEIRSFCKGNGDSKEKLYVPKISRWGKNNFSYPLTWKSYNFIDFQVLMLEGNSNHLSILNSEISFIYFYCVFSLLNQNSQHVKELELITMYRPNATDITGINYWVG